jgi:hypothetical protein
MLPILLLEELVMANWQIQMLKFIIGGFQQRLGAPWGAPDGWMLNYTNGRV